MSSVLTLLIRFLKMHLDCITTWRMANKKGLSSNVQGPRLASGLNILAQCVMSLWNHAEIRNHIMCRILPLKSQLSIIRIVLILLKKKSLPNFIFHFLCGHKSAVHMLHPDSSSSKHFKY